MIRFRPRRLRLRSRFLITSRTKVPTWEMRLEQASLHEISYDYGVKAAA